MPSDTSLYLCFQSIAPVSAELHCKQWCLRLNADYHRLIPSKLIRLTLLAVFFLFFLVFYGKVLHIFKLDRKVSFFKPLFKHLFNGDSDLVISSRHPHS